MSPNEFGGLANKFASNPHVSLFIQKKRSSQVDADFIFDTHLFFPQPLDLILVKVKLFCKPLGKRLVLLEYLLDVR